MPRNFRFPRVGVSELWIPLYVDNTAAGVELGRVRVIGRAESDLSLEAMDQRAVQLSQGLGDNDPMYAGWGVRVRRFGDGRAEPRVAQALWALTGAVGLMWLIAIGNAVNLLSMRAISRKQEIAIRLSLGASRGRVLRQLLTETLMVALMAVLK